MGGFTDLMRQRPVFLHEPVRSDVEKVEGRGIGGVEDVGEVDRVPVRGSWQDSGGSRSDGRSRRA